ncbi:MAG TPA: glycosyltransferase, partial [Candidatus Dependentiae bacterium]|nr:glycosyltransferase [Candidatus Dependentiae bacterium]
MDKREIKVNNNPLISIIVPCFNQGLYLPEALDSILAQTYQNWECIIVNDGSTDDTDYIAKRYCECDTRFKFIQKANGGLADARNEGIKNSNGFYILPLDSDDKISNNYLNEAIKILNDNPQIKLVYCDAELFGDETGKWNLPEYSFERLLYENHIFCTAIYKRSDFDKTYGYNVKMKAGWEDWDLWLSMLNANDQVYK